MSETLTYTDDSASNSELNADEQESLQIGEKMEAEHSALLAGKYDSPESLEKAYLELQQKLGQGQDEAEEVEEEGEEQDDSDASYEYDTNVLDRLWEEHQADGDEYSEELSEALTEMDAEELANLYLDYREQSKNSPDFADNEVVELQSIVGGSENYSQMISWAKDNADPNEIQLFDAVMESGDAASAYFAIRALGQSWVEAQGYEGELLQGKAARSTTSKFRSQAELVQAMSDPRYEDDEAYRSDVMNKLANSNISF